MKKILKIISIITIITLGIVNKSVLFANAQPMRDTYLNNFNWKFGITEGTTEVYYNRMLNNVMKYYGTILQDSRYQWVITLGEPNNFDLLIWDDYIVNPEPWTQPIGVTGSSVPYISTSGWGTVATASTANTFKIRQERTINYNHINGQTPTDDLIQEETIKMSATHVMALHTSNPYTRVLSQDIMQFTSIVAGRFYYNGVCIPGYADATSCPIMYNSPLLDWNGNIIVSEEVNDIKVSLDKQIDAVNKTTDTIKDDTVDNSQFDDFFSGFETNGHGVTAIITTPLMLLNHLTQDNCVALNLSLPFIDSNISLPCADSVMSSMIGNSAWDFFRTIFTGFISYKVLVDLLSFINNMRNPDNDNIEVIDL